MARVHMCYNPRCKKIIPFEQKYCDEHTKEVKKRFNFQYDKYSRNEDTKKFYQSKLWRGVRNSIVVRDLATCQVCGNATKKKYIVDHIKPLRWFGSSDQVKYGDSNLWTLCDSCHNKKTSLENEIYAERGLAAIAKMNQEDWKIRIKNYEQISVK